MDQTRNKDQVTKQDVGSAREDTPAPQFHAISPPQPIPVLNCIVYVAKESDGEVKARVANLPDMEFSAASEPAVLRLIVTEFKRRLAQWTELDEPIPWIDPPLELSSHEQQRLIPVHL